MMMNMTSLQTAWAIYFAGALGCTIAAWWMFLWAWRFVRYTAVVTVMTILFTPYAIDPQTMQLAPAIYTMVFEGMAQGVQSIKPLMKLMVGIWLIAVILVLLFVLLTRNTGKSHPENHEPHRKSRHKKKKNTRHYDYHKSEPKRSSRGLSHEEFHAREELLQGEVPIRAVRD